MIGIIDYGMGNLRSVANAVELLGGTGTIVRSPDDLPKCDRVIIPGVGSFDRAMRNLERRNLVSSIRDYAGSGAPILGICLGMQILSSSGSEPVITAGLGLISGNTARLATDCRHRLPHVGWNTVERRYDHPIFEGVAKLSDFYFVHSYAMICDGDSVLATTEYGITFPSAVGCGSVIGVQFHPEKSQGNGLKLLENFIHWDGQC